MNNRKRGFTLIEMLIVIVIVGILGATLIPKIRNVTSKARNVQRIVDMRNLSTALTTYRYDEGSVPMSSGAIGDISDKLTPYIKSIPMDPKDNKLNGILGSGTVYCDDYLPAGEYGYVALEGGQGFAVLSTMDEDTNVMNYNRGYSGEPLDVGSIMHGCIDASMTRKQLTDAQCDVTGFPGGQNLFTSDYDKGKSPGGFQVTSTVDFYPFAVPAPYGGGMAHRFHSQGGRSNAYVNFLPSTTGMIDSTHSVFVKILDNNAPSNQPNIGREYYRLSSPWGAIGFRRLPNGSIKTSTAGLSGAEGFISIRHVSDDRYLFSVTAQNIRPRMTYIGAWKTTSTYSNIAIRKPHLQSGMTAPCGDVVSYFQKPSGNQAEIQRRYIQVSD